MAEAQQPVDPSLLEVASAVADGRPVVWEKLDGTSPAVVSSLQEIEQIGRALRGGGVSSVDITAPRASPLFRWGRLEVEESIGRGGFGEVFRAWDPVLERAVALKLRHRGPSGHTDSGRRYIEEARRLARIRHPNVVTVHGADIHDGRVGLETDLVEGRTLDDELEKRGTWGAAEAAAVGLDLCRALAAVHGAGIVHGDVKPANVMRERGGRIVLMDFGAGIDLGADGRGVHPPAQATPAAAAPEVLRGDPPTVAADLYSLGVLLYRMLSGSYPVGGRSVGEIMAGHAAGSAVPLRDLRPDLPDRLVEVVETATALDPTARFGSAGAMERALHDALQTGPEESAAAPSRRRVLGWVVVAVSVAAVAIVTALALSRGGGSRPPGEPLRIAVLPFEDLSTDGGGPHLAEGIAENLTTDLARLGSLRVIARSSTVDAAARSDSLDRVADLLDVDRLCTGSVQSDGETLRITAQLVVPSTGEIEWASRYDRFAAEVGAVQAEVSTAIARALHVELEAADLAHLERRREADPDVLQSLMRARYYWHQRTREGVTRAEQLFRSAIDLDPASADAWAGLADALVIQVSYGWARPKDALPVARAAAERALALDDRHPAAHTSLASVLQLHDRDWDGAERHFRRAIETAPSLAQARTWYGELLMYSGRFAEGREQALAAFELDPLSPVPDLDVGKSFYYERRWREARSWLADTIRRHPDYPYAQLYLSLVEAEAGDLDASIARLLEIRERWPRFPEAVTLLAAMRARAGDRDTAREMLAELGELSHRRYVPPFAFVPILTWLGEHDAAVDRLEQSLAANDWQLVFIRVEPVLDPLRGDPRFERIVETAAAAAGGGKVAGAGPGVNSRGAI